MIASYLRTILTITFDCGVVPLGALAIERRKNAAKKARDSQGSVMDGYSYYGGPDPDPDSPGLEQFYTRDVFVCESDGRPKWCSECCNWKPDRAHHSSEVNRCVYRMDHYCPWVGGMIGENCESFPSRSDVPGRTDMLISPTAFKFFVQFTFYATCYTTLVVISIAWCLADKIHRGLGTDSRFIAGIVIAAFFGIFAFMMTATSMRYVFLNMTNVDMLSSRSKVYQLAVRVPRGTRSTDHFTTVTYPLPKLELGINGEANRRSVPSAAEAQVNRPGREARDGLATRTFAIFRTEPGENPWHLGYLRNWKEVMGTTVIDWVLPIRKSPCTNHESHESFYPMGRVLSDIRARYGFGQAATDEGHGLEMRQFRR